VSTTVRNWDQPSDEPVYIGGTNGPGVFTADQELANDFLLIALDNGRRERNRRLAQSTPDGSDAA
jgi:L-lactate utilization protein LutB